MAFSNVMFGIDAHPDDWRFFMCRAFQNAINNSTAKVGGAQARPSTFRLYQLLSARVCVQALWECDDNLHLGDQIAAERN
jgi:hypothetical protein